MLFQKKIDELGIKLPKAADPVGSYVAAKISGKMLFISGQISIDENGELIKGKIGNFSFNNKKVMQELDIYKVSNKKFIKY